MSPFLHTSRLGRWSASVFQDLRHGAVLLRRDATVSSLIVGVLALGIGGNAAIFTLLKAAFLDPLPYRDAERLVTIDQRTGREPERFRVSGDSRAQPHARADCFCRTPRHAARRNR